MWIIYILYYSSRVGKMRGRYFFVVANWVAKIEKLFKIIYFTVLENFIKHFTEKETQKNKQNVPYFEFDFLQSIM